MKVVFYSLSKTESRYSKGDRVICNIQTDREPAFYVGTVTMIREGKVYVHLDNGNKNSFKLNSKHLLGYSLKKTQRKSQIPEDQLGSWLFDKQTWTSIRDFKPKIKKDPKEDINSVIFDKMPIIGKKGLSGRVFCFTGFRDSNLEKIIKKLGGSVSTSITGRTTDLLVKSNLVTTKIQKAQKQGVRILRLDPFLNQITRVLNNL